MGFIQRTAEAARASIRGDMGTSFALMRHGDDYTPMSPFGGEQEGGFDTSPERLEALERFFRGGEAELEVVETYASGDVVVPAAIERRHGEIGGLPEQDWLLRVTWVFRRDGSEWRQVHRHADPHVHGISLKHLARLARGGPLRLRPDPPRRLLAKVRCGRKPLAIPDISRATLRATRRGCRFGARAGCYALRYDPVGAVGGRRC